MKRLTSRTTVILVILLACGKVKANSANDTIAPNYKIDVKRIIGPNDAFWKAAGHDFLFPLVSSSSGQYLLNRIEKYKSIKYLRTHNTFSNSSPGDKSFGQKISGQVLRKTATGGYRYDFSIVNETYRKLIKQGIKPIVEFDFYPESLVLGDASKNSEGFVGQTSPPKDWNEWQQLLHAFVNNLIKEFGRKELESWYFEVWNEPDNWPYDKLGDFFKLYDIFSSVVKSYDHDFKVGGPGCYNIFFLKPFLEHVVNQTNLFTGKKGSPIDFISYHIYGLSGAWLNKAPDIRPSVSRFSIELLSLQRVIQSYPALAKTELHINEWGLASNFEKEVKDYPDLQYRNSEFSALFLVKLIDCIYALKDNYNINLSMLLYWGFTWEAYKGVWFTGNRELTTGKNIPKPILTGFEFLSLLNNSRLYFQGPQPGGRFGILPTTNTSNELSVLVYNFNEEDDDLQKSDEFNLEVENIIAKNDIKIDCYTLDDKQNNTYRKWESLKGRPEQNDEGSYQILQSLESEPYKNFTSKNNTLQLKLTLKRHSMKLLKIHY